MPTSQQETESVRVTAENIGGIDATDLDVSPGVTVLSGQNATNRTSFLQAVMAAMGSDRATLKADADVGTATLRLAGTEHEQTLERRNGAVTPTGEGYLDDPDVAELFAFLLETNEARRAVSRREDLRELIMRPVDVESLKSEIERLESKRDQMNDRLEAVESRKAELPELERRRNEYRSEMDEKREEIAELESEIDDQSRSVERSRQEREELENKLEELREVRAEIDSVRRDVESQRESISSLRQRRGELEAELDELPDEPTVERAELDEQVDRLRGERQSLSDEISDLQSLIQYNEERLDGESGELLGTVDDGEVDESVTDELVSDPEEVVCWTCGSSVDREQIEDTVDRLRDVRSERVAELGEVKETIEELKTEKREVERSRERREECRRSLTEVEEEIDRRQRRLESLVDRRGELTDDVEALETAVDELESGGFEHVLDLHREANQLEFEIDRLRSELESVIEGIETAEEAVAEARELREERDRVVEALADERTKIDRIERNAVDRFNDHMETVLDVLEYENLDRIWIERLEETVRDGRQTVRRTVFDVHVVRTTESGTAYEDTVDHLSESEREVTGLVFALAGYLVHDLHETVPFMLMDSLEAIDADRIARLVDHFAEYADYLVVALLEEDARALSEEYDYVSDI